MVATVEDDRITKLRPDPDHPLSRGYACPKGIAMLDVQNDPDRVVHPLKKGADGEFHRVSWDEALDDIGERLRAIIDRHGKKSVGWYMGNPGAFSYSHPLWSKGFVDGLGSPHYYTAGSQDVNNRFAASALMYGSPLRVPIPDLERTSFLLMVGANPFGVYKDLWVGAGFDWPFQYLPGNPFGVDGVLTAGGAATGAATASATCAGWVGAGSCCSTSDGGEVTDPSPGAMCRTRWPWETESPTDTSTSVTVPAMLPYTAWAVAGADGTIKARSVNHTAPRRCFTTERPSGAARAD